MQKVVQDTFYYENTGVAIECTMASVVFLWVDARLSEEAKWWCTLRQ